MTMTRFSPVSGAILFAVICAGGCSSDASRRDSGSDAQDDAAGRDASTDALTDGAHDDVSALCAPQRNLDPWSWDPLAAPDAPLPWVHFDGTRFRLDDGREFVVRGLDYAYDTVGYTDVVVTLEEGDFARMAQWGATKG